MKLIRLSASFSLENPKKFPKKKPKSRVNNGPKVILGDDLKTEEQFSDPDKLYFTKSHLKEALKDFRDKFHDDKKMTDEQDVTRAEAGIYEYSILVGLSPCFLKPCSKGRSSSLRCVT